MDMDKEIIRINLFYGVFVMRKQWLGNKAWQNNKYSQFHDEIKSNTTK